MFRNGGDFRTDYNGSQNYRRNISYDNPLLRKDYYEPKFPKSFKREQSGDFGIYCNKLMKHSLITGFSVIAASKSNLRRSMKLLVLLICTAGFFYQTYYFLKMYLAFPTILDINMIHPEVISAPAVTLCNKNRLHREMLCNKFPDICEFKFKTREEFCEIYPKFCTLRKRKDEVYATVDQRYIVGPNRSIEVLNAVGPQSDKDFIKICTIAGKEKCNHSESIAIYASKEGYPQKCFAIKSLLGKPDEDPANISLTDEYSFFLSLQPEQYLKYKDLIQGYVFVHDPRSIVNAAAEGVTLKGGFKYNLYVTLDKRESLPKPYKTNCTDYLSMWKENGGYGPITKRDCAELCKIQFMMKKYGCVGQSITYPNNYTICDDKNLVTSEEAKAKCSEGCNDPCNLDVYSITLEVEDDFAELMCSKEDINCRNDKLGVKISFSRMMITKFTQQPKFESVEMFSYIGGYMGMWLGISLVSLFDFVEMLFDVLAYPVIKWRKGKKKTRRIENNIQRRSMFNMYDI